MQKHILNHVQSCVRMLHDGFDIIRNPKVKEKYPALYDTVVQHDRAKTKPYYNLTAQAHKEYLAYQQDYSIGYYMDV